MNKEIRFSLLSEEEEPRLMEAIVDIMQENDAHNLSNFDINYWKWQYKSLPSGKANVYVGKDDNKTILTYYHIPFYKGKWNETTTLYAMIQDVAVSNQLRGLGIFRKIATYANQHIDEEDTKVIYTFPNHRSIHTFLKYNDFRLLNCMDAFMMPVNTATLIRSKMNLRGIEKIIGGIFDFCYKIFFVRADKKASVQRIDAISQEVADLYAAFGRKFKYGLIKDQAYLDWRFIRKPKQQNFIYTISGRDARVKAVVFLKKDKIKGIPCLLLMDYAYADGGENYFLQLLTHLRNNNKKYFEGKAGLLYTSMNAEITSRFGKIGLFRLPQKVNPRPLNLLVRANDADNDIYEKKNWQVTLCDWDVF